MLVRRGALALLLTAALASPAVPAQAATPLTATPLTSTSRADTLPSVTSGPRPGPDALYAPAPRAPQLENTGPWRADPILISGTEAYRDGEWIYQDFLYDDHGATGVEDRNDPYGIGDFLFSPTAGTFTYPLDPVYATNAADLLELRIKPVEGATLFRVSLNTLQDPERTAFTIALGDANGDTAWPHGAGVSSPAAHFLTVHGSTAELLDAATDEPTAVQPTVSTDLERRQVEIRVPTAAWDPGSDTVRTTIGVGLWDAANDSYLRPAPGNATQTTPGGGNPLTRTAIVNVGPRFSEPQPAIRGKGYTIGDTAVTAAAEASWWRELAQARALTLGDVSPFSADVDFATLRAGTTDDSAVPTSGSFDRIFPTAHVFGQGLDNTQVCTDVPTGLRPTPECKGRFVGQLQPYNVYVPDKPVPPGGFGLTLLLHSLSANYNQYAASAYQRQLGERGAGSIVITPNGRGSDGFYMGYTETDTFEVWADVARHYRLDPTWVASSGYSMGGFGTYRLMARYPDLFGRGFSVVGIPGSVRDQLPSLRNTPVLAWNDTLDELVPVDEAEDAHRGLVEAGVPHVYDQFLTADHLTLASNDEYGPGADFLAEARADRDPSRITYVVDPREDNPAAQVVADHAYWLSGLRVRDAEAGTGTIEVRSEAFGEGVPEVQPVTVGAGTVTGGAFGTAPYAERRQDVAEPAAAPKADRLVVSATNVGRVVVDPARAQLSCAADVQVESDGPLEVVLEGCNRTVGAPGGTASSAGQSTGTTTQARGTLAATGPAALLPLLSVAALTAAAALRRRRS